MASFSSGTVTNSIGGTVLTFTDTGSYTAPIVSRSLQINDYNGNPLATINMGASLTAIYNITADQYITFILSVTDNTGVVPPATVNYLAQGFYTIAYLNAITQSGCGCNGVFCNLDIAENFLKAAQRFGIAGNGVAAQSNILAGNVYANMQQ